MNFIIFKFYLFLDALGLHCCTQAFSSCGEQVRLFVAVCVLLIASCGLICSISSNSNMEGWLRMERAWYGGPEFNLGSSQLREC